MIISHVLWNNGVNLLNGDQASLPRPASCMILGFGNEKLGNVDVEITNNHIEVLSFLGTFTLHRTTQHSIFGSIKLGPKLKLKHRLGTMPAV